jgi:hypothetical protein
MMKRRTPLKRTAMKRTRKTPRHQNPELRQAYREANADDEWSKYLPGIEVWVGRPVDMTAIMGVELNHIFKRRDDVSNFMMLSAYHHRFFHRHIQCGRVLCMLVKCLKGEADVAFWTQASGKQVVSWVESLGDLWLPGDWMRPYWKQLVDLLGKEQG